MHPHLCKYMAAAQLETAQQQLYCIATDKGTPGGYGLQNTLLSFPCGLGVIAPPVVSDVGHVSPGRSFNRRWRPSEL